MAGNVGRTGKSAEAVADRLAVQKGLRLTRIRRTVLRLMSSADKAMGAYDILAEFHKEKPDVKPVTVYRSLEFLMEHGLIHRIESSNAYIVCCRPGTAHRSQLLVCDLCGSVKEVEASQISDRLDERARRAGFAEFRHTLETHGVCRDCRT